MEGLAPGSAAPDASDAALAARVRLGDREAEGELCRRFRPRIRLYGLRHLRDEAAAADLAQDVLIVVIGCLRQGAVREVDRLASFVLGACRRLAGGAQRTGRRREAILAAAPAPEPSSPGEVIPRERLGQCLEALTARERAIVLATFYAEQPTEEIAGEHGLSPGNVRVVRHRALRRLRACLGFEEAA